MVKETQTQIQHECVGPFSFRPLIVGLFLLHQSPFTLVQRVKLLSVTTSTVLSQIKKEVSTVVCSNFCAIISKESYQIQLFTDTVESSRLTWQGRPGEWVEGGGCLSGCWVGIGWLPYAAHAPGADHTLQRPEHDDHQQHHEDDEEQYPLPVPQPVHEAQSLWLGLGRSGGLAGPDVDADAESRGAVRGVVYRALIAELLPVQPHGLLVLLVGGQPAEDLPAGGQGGGAFLRQRGGVTAEGTGEASLPAGVVLLGCRERHEAWQALQAEGVGALQQLGRFEDVVVRVVADGALRLTRHRHLLLNLAGRVDLHVPDLWGLHLQGVRAPSPPLSPLWTLCGLFLPPLTSGWPLDYLQREWIKSRD